MMKKSFMLLLGICFAVMSACSVAQAELVYAYTWYEYDSWYDEMKPKYDVYLSTEETEIVIVDDVPILLVRLYSDYQPYQGLEGKWPMVAQYHWTGTRWVGEPSAGCDLDKILDMASSYGLLDGLLEEAQEREERERIAAAERDAQ